MKRLALLMLAPISVGGCDDRGSPASAYRSWKNQVIVAVGLRSFFDLCAVKKETKYGNVYERIPLDKCYKMDPPRRWKGLWRNDFEGSRFCASPAKFCDDRTTGPQTWFDYDDPKLLPFGGLYEVDFIGRRTSVRGRYGHMGGSDYEIVIDRLISMTTVEPPPPPLTKEQREAETRRCEAEPNCLTFKEMMTQEFKD